MNAWAPQNTLEHIIKCLIVPNIMCLESLAAQLDEAAAGLSISTSS